jgi:Cu/Ag efflux protein CusF
MTMTYRVKDPAWLKEMAAGQKIRFAAESVDGGMVMVRFESVK